MEVWILIFTMWVLGSDGNYTAQEHRAEFPTSEACAADGNTRMAEATEKQQPAVFFCFKKGEKIG